MWDIGLSQPTSAHFILNHGGGFYKPTIPQYTPSHLQDYSTCNSATLECPTYFFYPSFDPNEWHIKNGLFDNARI